jgi:hypothetical protein
MFFEPFSVKTILLTNNYTQTNYFLMKNPSWPEQREQQKKLKLFDFLSIPIFQAFV